MRIEILGVPIAKARARVVRRGNLSMAYDPQDKEKKSFKSKLAKQINIISESADIELLIEFGNISTAEAFNFDIEAYMPIPKSYSKAKRKRIEVNPFHNIKPDGDNIFKFVTDCSNGILYKDDSQIVKGSFVKKYSDNPRTVININPINLNQEGV